MNPRAQCIHECRQCAGLFRLGRDVEASLTMVDIFEEAQRLFVDAAQEIQQQWGQLLALILACQEKQDWLGLADFMEYELVGLLEIEQA